MSHMVRFKAITLSSFSRRVSSSVRPALNNETATCIVVNTKTYSEMRSSRTLNEAIACGTEEFGTLVGDAFPSPLEHLDDDRVGSRRGARLVGERLGDSTRQ